MANTATISKTEDGTRLMRWFMRRFPSMPQREFYKLCRGGQIRVNSSRCRGNEVLRAGDVVRVPPTLAAYADAPKKTGAGDSYSLADLESLRRCIIYNDDDIVAFNKPAGLAVQGGTGIRKSVDKMAAAMFPYDKISLVHRLDRETSGVLVVAKNQRAAQVLAASFQNKTTHKEYLALLRGRVSPARGVIDNYMAKGDVFDTPARLQNGTGPRPQRAVTEYNTLAEVGDFTWIEFMPKTGRTHQLRVHSAKVLNAPIVGDEIYGGPAPHVAVPGAPDGIKKLFLFAHKITFQHPTSGRMVTLRATLPEFMRGVVKFLELRLP